MSSLAGPLLSQLSGRFTGAELDQVRSACAFAAQWHGGQRRKSSAPYITHPLAVAEAAAAARLNCAVVCAALPHDLPGVANCDLEFLRAEFGDEIADLVSGLTAFSWGEPLPDDRVIALKLLDRLHNMRTIEHVDAGRQLSRSRETLKVFVPQARRLGLPAVADELEKLSGHRIDILAGEATGGTTAALCALQLGSLILPAAARTRYLEEWAAELRVPASRRLRRRFAAQLIIGLPQLSLMLRRPQWDRLRTGIAHHAALIRLTRTARSTLSWILSSDTRTWALLVPLTT